MQNMDLVSGEIGIKSLTKILNLQKHSYWVLSSCSIGVTNLTGSTDLDQHISH
jgi:hypothetical protein